MISESAKQFMSRKDKQFREELADQDSIKMKDISREGGHRFFREAWCFLPQSNIPNDKVFIVERLRKIGYTGKIRNATSWRKGDIEYRFGYFIRGGVGRTKGKWIWGQFSPLIPRKDLAKLMAKARRAGVLG